MSLNINLQKQEGEKKEYDLIPDDTYEVVIENIEKKEQKMFESEEMEDVLEFRFAFVEEGDHKGRKLWKYARIKLSPAGEYPASTLYKIYSSVTNTSLDWGGLDELNSKDIEDLQGKRLRLVVGNRKVGSGKNKGNTVNAITGYLPTKMDSNEYKEETAEPTEEQKEKEIPF